jgi:hypothetical protein
MIRRSNTSTRKHQTTFSAPVEAKRATANNSESPGRIGVTTKPVSQKIIRKENAVRPSAVLPDQTQPGADRGEE